MSTVRIVAAVSLMLVAAAPVFAASDYLLTLDGVKGEGEDQAAPQTVEVESFSWGVSNAGSTATGTVAGAGKVSMQDLSVTAARAPREASSGMATGKRAAPLDVADGDGHTDTAVPAPKVGDVATFTVVTRESPSKSSTGKAGACVTGTHFPHAVVVAQGRRYEFSDVVITSCAVAEGLSKKDFRGHVTLMK